MKRLVKRVLFCCLIVCFVLLGMLLADRRKLSQELIRFHVVANSDMIDDQQVKLQVRDAILESLSEDLSKLKDFREAKAYLLSNIPKMEAVARETLLAAGFSPNVKVTLEDTAFDIRNWENLRFPSGVYQTLRIVIGEGNGHNWWCVLFPGYCGEESAFVGAAREAGFTPNLVNSLSGDEGYEVRFFLLDALGKVQTALFS